MSKIQSEPSVLCELGGVKAMKIVFELSEYVVPKLVRTELNGKFSNDSLPEDLSILSTEELVKRAEASRAIEQNKK